jgi:hypothetical protein
MAPTRHFSASDMHRGSLTVLLRVGEEYRSEKGPERGQIPMVKTPKRTYRFRGIMTCSSGDPPSTLRGWDFKDASLFPKTFSTKGNPIPASVLL